MRQNGALRFKLFVVVLLLLLRQPFITNAFVPSARHPFSRREQSLTSFAIKQRDKVKEVKGADKGADDRPRSILIEEGEGRTIRVNGKRGMHMHNQKKVNGQVDNSRADEDAFVVSTDLLDFMEEVESKVISGTAEILSNLTSGVEEQLVKLPETSAQELSTLLTELSSEIQQAQKSELERQIAALERRLIRPLEDLAFNDVPLWEDKKTKKSSTGDQTDVPPAGLMRDQLVLMGKNSTLELSRRMRTKEILQNFNVAPFYYSIALLTRWARKASYPSIYLLSMYRNMANVVKSNTKAKKKFQEPGGEGLQAGWKRTGEIAAKGSLAKKWAVFRRSAEIWAYFSSFYLKDRRISAKYNSGKWSEAKYKEERSKLGKEITDNLLKLGPTFIKGELLLLRFSGFLVGTNKSNARVSLSRPAFLYTHRYCTKGVH